MRGTLHVRSLTLDLDMSPDQFASGYAERVAQRLRNGQFDILRGRWRVIRGADAPESERDGVRSVRVKYWLMPLDSAARTVATRESAPA